MSTAFRQDMPPSGGYAPVHYERVPTKKILNGEWLERSQFGNDIFCRMVDVGYHSMF